MKLEINFQIGDSLKKEVLQAVSEKEFFDLFDLIKSFLLNNWKLNGIAEDKFISLNFITDNEIKELNKNSRWKDKSTDCLSFPYEPEDFIPLFWEVFIAMPYIQNQAQEYWVSLKYEISKMFIHSVLHLFWYDHQNDEEFREMEELEKKIMEKWGFSE